MRELGAKVNLGITPAYAGKSRSHITIEEV